LSGFTFNQFSSLNFSSIISFVDALFANSYIFVLSAVESVTQNEANRFVRFCSSKLSENVAEKYSALLPPYLLFNLSIAHLRKFFHSLFSLSFLNLEVILRISHAVADGWKIIIEYIAGVIVLDDSIQEFHTQLTASQNRFQNLSSKYSFVNHHVSNLLNNMIGFSHVNAWDANITDHVVNAFPQNDIFLFVKNLYSQ
jgi:hypothetical protein